MHVSLARSGATVKCGTKVGRFLRISGSDAVIELQNGSRVMWSCSTEVETLSDAEEVQVNQIPKAEAELTRLEAFTSGKYALLGVTVDTPCVQLPKQLHPLLVSAALGSRPDDAVLCRRCGQKLCIRADHLFWGTRSDCQRDMCLRGVAKPSGKLVTAVDIAARIVRLRSRLTRLRENF